MTVGHSAPSFAAVTIVLAAAAWPQQAFGGAAECAVIEQAEERLACYDRLYGGTDPDPESSHREEPSATPPPAEGPDDVLAEVVATGEGLTGRRWFRLDSGQLWEQVTPHRTDIEAGDTVRIGQGVIGTYHLRRSDGSSRSSQVRRLE